MQWRTVVSVALVGVLSGCPRGKGSTTWRNVLESEPNDSLGTIQDLGTTPPRTGLRIRGATDPFDVDQYQIDSSDYLDVHFTLTPDSSNTDVDLILLDGVYFYVELERFEDTPPPLAETGSFEFLPGDIRVLMVVSYGQPSDYTLELECVARGSAASASDRSGLAVAEPPSAEKQARNDQKVARVLAHPEAFPSTTVGRVDVVELPEARIVWVRVYGDLVQPID